MKTFFSIIILSVFSQLTKAQQFVLVDSIAIENKAIKTIETDLNNSLYLISDTKISSFVSVSDFMYDSFAATACSIISLF